MYSDDGYNQPRDAASLTFGKQSVGNTLQFNFKMNQSIDET